MKTLLNEVTDALKERGLDVETVLYTFEQGEGVMTQREFEVEGFGDSRQLLKETLDGTVVARGICEHTDRPMKVVSTSVNDSPTPDGKVVKIISLIAVADT